MPSVPNTRTSQTFHPEVVCSLSVIAVMVLIIAFKNLMPIKVLIVSICSLFIYIFMCYSLIAN